MLKKILNKIRTGKSIPIWADILVKALEKMGFGDLELLLTTQGMADLSFVVKGLQEWHLHSLAALMDNLAKVKIILNEDDSRRKDRKTWQTKAEKRKAKEMDPSNWSIHNVVGSDWDENLFDRDPPPGKDKWKTRRALSKKPKDQTLG